MEMFSALLAICAGNSPQRPVTRSFDVFFALRPNKRLSKHGKAGDLRRHSAHYDVTVMICRRDLAWFDVAFSDNIVYVCYMERPGASFANMGYLRLDHG